MKWEVQISADKHDLKEIAKSLQNDELRIIERDNHYYLKSTRFNNLNTSEEVSDAASKILPILSGAVKLSLGSKKSLRIVGITRDNDDGTRDIFVSVEASIAVSATVGLEIKRKDGKIEIVNPADKLPVWMNLSFSDPKVAKAFRLLGSQKHDWVCLYRIYEIIEDDIGGKDNIIKQGWAKKDIIKLFKRTANSPKAIGDISRHGKESKTPPSNPMELGEAQALIKILLYNWLSAKMK